MLINQLLLSNSRIADSTNCGFLNAKRLFDKEQRGGNSLNGREYLPSKSKTVSKTAVSLRAGSLVGTENENRREEWDEEKSLFVAPFFSPSRIPVPKSAYK